MPRILVTNDDGVRSDGIHALAAALHPLGDVAIVAPHIEASAIGHALTLRRPLRMERIADNVFEVDGTPTDCVNVGVARIFQAGYEHIERNIALEGALLGVPSLAVSLERTSGTYDFGPAAAAAVTIASMLLQNKVPPPTFLSLNVPTGKPKGFRVTFQAKRNHVTIVDERLDPRGRAYYWIEEGENNWEPHDRSDFQAVRDGYISVTPLKPDLTDYNALVTLQSLALETTPCDTPASR